MKQTTKGFLAGAAGLGLLLGGSTFALWTDSDNVPSSTITAGNLQVEVGQDAKWRDISPDRSITRWRGGHDIEDIEQFKIIPGDKIQAKYPVHVALEGDNMVAKLQLKQHGKKADGALRKALDIKYEVLNQDGEVVESSRRHGVSVTLASEDNDDPRGLRQIQADIDGEAEFTVVVTVKFKDTEDLNLRKAQAELATAELELEQVRERVPGYSGGRR